MNNWDGLLKKYIESKNKMTIMTKTGKTLLQETKGMKNAEKQKPDIKQTKRSNYIQWMQKGIYRGRL